MLIVLKIQRKCLKAKIKIKIKEIAKKNILSV
jgi:hypothetical protein